MLKTLALGALLLVAAAPVQDWSQRKC